MKISLRLEVLNITISLFFNSSKENTMKQK